MVGPRNIAWPLPEVRQNVGLRTICVVGLVSLMGAEEENADGFVIRSTGTRNKHKALLQLYIGTSEGFQPDTNRLGAGGGRATEETVC